jgi:CheY-like chemotaxis protein/DNA-binding CsgD family transcriptional regulator
MSAPDNIPARDGEGEGRTAAAAAAAADTSNTDVVLVVDDVPDNLSLLHDALDEAGYMVLVATNGESALQRALQAMPDIILLDAVMPGMDGFEVARRLKARPETAHIPIVFMTGLTETEHVVSAFQAGGVDYVTKPIRPKEVLARMAVHVQGARQARQARNALDAFGYATITVRERDGRLMWQTALARELLARYCGPATGFAPPEVLQWLQRNINTSRAIEAHLTSNSLPHEPPRLTLDHGPRRLTFRLHQHTGDGDVEPNGEGGDWLIVIRETNDASVVEALVQAFGLTAREAEVLYWVVQGKINRDIADIVGASPATVKKHLERILPKLGVETRTAAAAMAINRVGLLST